jgi:hypothetical protein
MSAMTKQELDELLLIGRKSRLVVRTAFFGVILFNSLATLYTAYQGNGWFSFSVLLIGLFVFALVFLFNQGPDPRKWWSAMWGTEILLDYNTKTALTLEDRTKYMADMEAWVETEIPKHDVVKVNPWRYHFRRKNQAMLFKMTWL